MELIQNTDGGLHHGRVKWRGGMSACDYDGDGDATASRGRVIKRHRCEWMEKNKIQDVNDSCRRRVRVVVVIAIQRSLAILSPPSLFNLPHKVPRFVTTGAFLPLASISDTCRLPLQLNRRTLDDPPLLAHLHAVAQ